MDVRLVKVSVFCRCKPNTHIWNVRPDSGAEILSNVLHLLVALLSPFCPVQAQPSHWALKPLSTA